MKKVGHWEVTNVSSFNFKDSNTQKFTGKFRVILNHNLPMAKKIEQFAIDPVSFHLHKKRNFVNKLKWEESELKKKVHEQEMMDKILKL